MDNLDGARETRVPVLGVMPVWRPFRPCFATKCLTYSSVIFKTYLNNYL